MQDSEIEILTQLDAAIVDHPKLTVQAASRNAAVPHKLLQIAIWRAFQTQTVTEGAPVLEFDCNEVLETSKFRHSSEGWNPANVQPNTWTDWVPAFAGTTGLLDVLYREVARRAR